jgi:hypothetical protein
VKGIRDTLEQLEGRLEEQEKFAERFESKRKQELHDERMDMMSAFDGWQQEGARMAGR